MANELVPAQQKAITMRDYLNEKHIKGPLEMALPKWLSVDRLLRIVFTCFMKNPKLLECTKESILQSVMQCAQLGLEPILGRAYLIPYSNNKQINGKWQKVLECQFQPGYQGLVDLGRRSGQVKDVFAMVVYENDEFELEYGTSRRLLHKPHLGEDPGEPLGAYTVWELEDDVKSFEFMPLHEIYKRRAKSQAYQYAVDNPGNKKAQEAPWIQWPEEQMKKTVVKHHAKLQPASIEVMQAVELDNAIDLGRSQLGMFTGEPNLLTMPEHEPDEYDTTEFDRLVKHAISGAPLGPLREFIKLTADSLGVTEDQLKHEAAKDFAGFWNQFNIWREKHYKKDHSNGQGHPGLHGPPEEIPPDPLDRRNWINLQPAGYPTFIYKHPEEIKKLKIENPPLYEEMRAKWYRLSAEPWPHDPVLPSVPPTDDPPPVEQNQQNGSTDADLQEAKRTYREWEKKSPEAWKAAHNNTGIDFIFDGIPESEYGLKEYDRMNEELTYQFKGLQEKI